MQAKTRGPKPGYFKVILARKQDCNKSHTKVLLKLVHWYHPSLSGVDPVIIF